MASVRETAKNVPWQFQNLAPGAMKYTQSLSIRQNIACTLFCLLMDTTQAI